MRQPGTLQKILPSSVPRVKLPRPTDVPANCGPEINFPGKKRHRQPKKGSRMNAQEWQQPRRVGKWHRPNATFSMPLRNRFDGLPTPESKWGPVQTPNWVPPLQPRQVHNHRRLPRTIPTEREVSPTRVRHKGRVRVQPHGNSYFLPAKIAGKAVTFLLDSGCTTNLVSHQLFDTLSAKLRGEMEPYNGECCTLADGSCILFDGIIELTGRVRDQTIQEMFIVSQLKEDAILGMSFLKRHGCHIDFSKSAIVMSGRELACVNKFGRPLVGDMQVVWNCTILGCSRATIYCKVNNSQLTRLGVVEGKHYRIQLASSLTQLSARGEILLQCVNPFTESVKLPAGSMVGGFHSVQEGDMGPSLEDTAEGPHQRPHRGRGTIPPHVRELYEAACHGCGSNEECQAMVKLLRKYSDMFSSGDHDVGLTRAVRYEISLAAGTVPLRQPTRRLGKEKEKEVSPQIWDLLARGLIEPAHSAWSSPFILV